MSVFFAVQRQQSDAKILTPIYFQSNVGQKKLFRQKFRLKILGGVMRAKSRIRANLGGQNSDRYPLGQKKSKNDATVKFIHWY